MTRRLACTLTAVLFGLGLGAAQPTAARAGGNDNSAIAVNTKDGSSVFKLAFAIREVAGDVVDSTNTAVAYASCTDCQTVAIAIQIVFVIGSPSVVTPTNVAVAVNDMCTNCQTLALAYQFVVGVSGPVRFTHDGKREIDQIREELERLKHSGLPIAEIRTRVAALMDRLKTVLKTQLVQKGKSGKGEIKSKHEGASNGSSTTPTETTDTETTDTTTIPEDTTTTDTTQTDTTQTDTTQTETTPTTP